MMANFITLCGVHTSVLSSCRHVRCYGANVSRIPLPGFLVKRLLVGAILASGLAAPLQSARADVNPYGAFCTTGLVINFCGSVQVSATPSAGGTNVVLTILNTSGGAAGGSAGAVFTAIGLENVATNKYTTFSNLHVIKEGSPGTDYASEWQIDANKTIGGGLNVDVLPHTDHGIQYGISSACGPIAKRITTGGIGGCPGGAHSVVISFHTSAVFAANDVKIFIKQQGTQSSECLLGNACSPHTTSTVPEPATLLLVGTGLLGLGGRLKRRRSKNGSA